MSSTAVTTPFASVITRWAANCGRTERNWISLPELRNASTISSRGASVRPSP